MPVDKDPKNQPPPKLSYPHYTMRPCDVSPRPNVPRYVSPRPVAFIVKPQPADEAKGVQIGRSIGNGTLVFLDPVMLCDHVVMEGPDDQPKGFPKHPHRGIETLTWVVQGTVFHRDSSGKDDSVRTRGSQWMTAGSGIYHAEMFAPENGRCEGLQLWFNLPAAKKQTPPAYASAQADQIPTITQNEVKVAIVAGEYQGTKGAFQGIAVDPTILSLDLPAGTQIEIPSDPAENAFLYLFTGKIQIDEAPTPGSGPKLVVLASGDLTRISNPGPDPVHALYVAAKPLAEPVMQYRSVIMNTVDEMKTAVDDLKNNTFINHPDQLA